MPTGRRKKYTVDEEWQKDKEKVRGTRNWVNGSKCATIKMDWESEKKKTKLDGWGKIPVFW